MTARSIGSATVAFGLVSIPVKLYTTSETSDDIHFNMLHEADGARLKQQYVCTKCNEVVDREHTVKGFEHAKGQYVILSADEMKALDAVATQTIALEEFVPVAELEPLYIEKSYYLGPDKGGERAYALLRAAMVETNLVGVASYSARGKQHIVSLRPFKDGLILHQLRYSAEVKPWTEVPMPELPEIKAAELALARQVIAPLAHQTWSPEKYKDEVQARMAELIRKKIDGGEIVVEPTAPPSSTIDLMAAMKASIEKAATTAPTPTNENRIVHRDVKPEKSVAPKKKVAAKRAVRAAKKRKRAA